MRKIFITMLLGGMLVACKTWGNARPYHLQTRQRDYHLSIYKRRYKRNY